MNANRENLGSPARANILLVDDDPSVQSSLANALQSEDYAVVGASDGQEALRILQQQHIDLVLLDLNLPLVRGWDVFERMTAVEPCLPIVIITARSDQSEKAALAGATALLEKPISIPGLVALIDRLTHESIEERTHRILTHQPVFAACSEEENLSSSTLGLGRGIL